MTEKKDDFLTWGILGAVGAAVVGLVLSGLGKSNSNNQPVNSYQATDYYTPPSSPPDGGCGCGA